MVASTEQATVAFSEFFAETEPILRHALVASCGPEVGREAAADAFEYAWRHWDRVALMEHPVGYLFRVGRSAAKKYRKRPVAAEPQIDASLPWFEPGLVPELRRLSDRQRTAVVLRHSFGCTYDEISRVMGVSVPTVQKHVERALGKLRSTLEVAP
ncbi:MAG: sigma-70 family RNA polymerase sigma factor [Acidimicrobiia bacterium]